MNRKSSAKLASAGSNRSVSYAFDRNGTFVVDPCSLLANTNVRAQISAAAKLGRLQNTRSQGANGSDVANSKKK